MIYWYDTDNHIDDNNDTNDEDDNNDSNYTMNSTVMASSIVINKQQLLHRRLFSCNAGHAEKDNSLTFFPSCWSSNGN